MLSAMDFSDVVGAVAARLKAELQESAAVGHAVGKGRVRESAVLAQVLQRFLPETVGIVQSAEVVSSHGTVSSECDLVVYDRDFPFIYRSATYSVLPIEAVLGVIEVKSKLNARELKDAARKLHEVKCMPRSAVHAPNQMGIVRYGRNWDIAPVSTYVLAFDSTDISALGDKLREAEAGWLRWECIDAVFVLDKGVLVDAGFAEQRQVLETRWENGALKMMLMFFMQVFQRRPQLRFQAINYFQPSPLGIAVEGFGEWNSDGTQRE